MSDLQEPTPNISSLSVLYPEGNFPSHIDIFGKGGFIALNDAIGGSGYSEFINERVTLERRKPGMLVYINSDNTYHKCATAGSSESTGEWDRQYFSGRYFYGASAPTASDVVMGEKWFNTDVGSEFTYLPIDENQNTFFWVDIDHLGQGESGDIGIDLLVNGVSFATDSPTLNITGSSPINVASEGGNGYRISLTDNFVNTSGDNMTGTLTGTDASFDSITASNGFIGTLTGNNIRYTNAEFGTESLIIQGSSATFTDMSVMITGDSTFDINDMSIGTTFDAGNGQNLNVYRIFAQDGVALGGNDISKNNWLGNNVFLAPSDDHSVLIGLPLSRDASNHEKLTVTGGIVTKRIFATGSLYPGLTSLSDGKAFNTLAYSLAAGITTVDGYETPLFSVQERQPGGGWVNAPKIRRVWPTGERNSTSRTDPVFENDEYVTKSYVDTYTSGSEASGTGSYSVYQCHPYGDGSGSCLCNTGVCAGYTYSWYLYRYIVGEIEGKKVLRVIYIIDPIKNDWLRLGALTISQQLSVLAGSSNFALKTITTSTRDKRPIGQNPYYSSYYGLGFGEAVLVYSHNFQGDEIRYVIENDDIRFFFKSPVGWNPGAPPHPDNDNKERIIEMTFIQE